MRFLVGLILSFGLNMGCLWGQLHLIAGTRTGRGFPPVGAALFVVKEGAVRQIVELVPHDTGVEWIGISYDLRKSVLLPVGGDPPLILDLDKASVVKRCPSLSAEDGRALAWSLEQWLADVPGRGPTFEWYVGGERPGSGYVRGMQVDPRVPCEKSFISVPPSEIQYIVAHGSAGVGDYVAREDPIIFMDQDGKLSTRLADTRVYFGYQLPQRMRDGLEGNGSWAGMVVNNSQVMVVGLAASVESTPIFRVFRKRDQTWHVMPTKNFLQACLRGFGRYVAIVETARRSGTTAGGATNPDAAQAGPSRPDAESPGRAEWRLEPSRLGPSIGESFDEAIVAYPGRLHLYNIETEKLFTIETRQADSEILLVENGIVYYRVSNRLYSAPVTESGIGTPRLIATDEVIRDAHWAFIKP